MIQLTELDEIYIFIPTTEQGIHVLVVLATWCNYKTNYLCLLIFLNFAGSISSQMVVYLIFLTILQQLQISQV